MASLAVPTTTRLKPICFKNVRNRSCTLRSSSTTNTVGWPCLSWRRMSWSREDFLPENRVRVLTTIQPKIFVKEGSTRKRSLFSSSRRIPNWGGDRP